MNIHTERSDEVGRPLAAVAGGLLLAGPRFEISLLPLPGARELVQYIKRRGDAVGARVESLAHALVPAVPEGSIQTALVHFGDETEGLCYGDVLDDGWLGRWSERHVPGRALRVMSKYAWLAACCYVDDIKQMLDTVTHVYGASPLMHNELLKLALTPSDRLWVSTEQVASSYRINAGRRFLFHLVTL